MRGCLGQVGDARDRYRIASIRDRRAQPFRRHGVRAHDQSRPPCAGPAREVEQVVDRPFQHLLRRRDAQVIVQRPHGEETARRSRCRGRGKPQARLPDSTASRTRTTLPPLQFGQGGVGAGSEHGGRSRLQDLSPIGARNTRASRGAGIGVGPAMLTPPPLSPAPGGARHQLRRSCRTGGRARCRAATPAGRSAAGRSLPRRPGDRAGRRAAWSRPAPPCVASAAVSTPPMALRLHPTVAQSRRGAPADQARRQGPHLAPERVGDHGHRAVGRERHLECQRLPGERQLRKRCGPWLPWSTSPGWLRSRSPRERGAVTVGQGRWSRMSEADGRTTAFRSMSEPAVAAP